MYDGIKRQAEMLNKAGLPFSIGQQTVQNIARRKSWCWA